MHGCAHMKTSVCILYMYMRTYSMQLCKVSTGHAFNCIARHRVHVHVHVRACVCRSTYLYMYNVLKTVPDGAFDAPMRNIVADAFWSSLGSKGGIDMDYALLSLLHTCMRSEGER